MSVMPSLKYLDTINEHTPCSLCILKNEKKNASKYALTCRLIKNVKGDLNLVFMRLHHLFIAIR